MSYFLRPHGLQHARLPCPSLSSGVCNLVLYSPGLHFHHQTHPQLSIISALAQLRFFLDLLAIVLHFSPVAYWTPSNLGGSSSGVISFCLFTLLMGLSRQEYWSGFLFPPPVEMELLKFPAYNIVLNFFGKKKEMGAKKKILSYCSPQSLHPPFPRVCESFFPDIYKIVNGQALSYTQVVCACSSSPFFNNKRGCTPLQICSLFCVFL